MNSGLPRLSNEITPNDYQQWTRTTAIYPDSGTGSITSISYCALGLVGEAGEVADKIKKLIRDGDTPERRNAVIGELGDVAWYLARLADEFGLDFDVLLINNQRKLNSRKERNVLSGNGDNR